MKRALHIFQILCHVDLKYQLTFHLSDVLQVLDLNFQLLVFLGQSEDGVLGRQKLGLEQRLVVRQPLVAAPEVIELSGETVHALRSVQRP